MSNAAEALAWSIDPIPLDTFLSEYWEQKPLVVSRNKPAYFAKLLSLRAVDQILSSTNLRVPGFRLVRQGAQIPTSAYTTNVPMTPSVFQELADPDRIYAEYQNGASIVLQALERSWQPLIEYCKQLENYFGHPIQANMYLTPENAQGFGAHYDTHDTLILQIEGRKRWKIYDAPVPLPLNEQKYSSDKIKFGEPVFDMMLNAGDTLYMPRGVGHEALTSDSYSLHVTIGIKVVTWADVLSQVVAKALEECKQDVAFRKSLPLNFAGDEHSAEVNQTLANMIEQFEERLDANQAHELAASKFVMSRWTFAKERLPDLYRVQGLNGESKIRRRENVIFRIKQDTDTITCFFQGKRVSFPSYVAEAVVFVTKADSFRVSEIPDVVDDAGKLVLVKRLVREGFLTIGNDADAA